MSRRSSRGRTQAEMHPGTHIRVKPSNSFSRGSNSGGRAPKNTSVSIIFFVSIVCSSPTTTCLLHLQLCPSSSSVLPPPFCISITGSSLPPLLVSLLQAPSPSSSVRPLTSSKLRDAAATPIIINRKPRRQALSLLCSRSSSSFNHREAPPFLLQSPLPLFSHRSPLHLRFNRNRTTASLQPHLAPVSSQSQLRRATLFLLLHQASPSSSAPRTDAAVFRFAGIRLLQARPVCRNPVQDPNPDQDPRPRPSDPAQKQASPASHLIFGPFAH